MATISKELKGYIQREVEALWHARCDSAAGTGWGRSYGVPREKFALHKAGIRIKDYSVEQDGRKLAIIHRRYAQRKVNLYYRELKPTIEWLEEAA